MATSYIKLMLQLDVSKRLHTDNGFASAPCSTEVPLRFPVDACDVSTMK